MKLIIGIGNPGKEYEKTRHNVGFVTLDKIIKNLEKDPGEEFELNQKFSAQIAQIKIKKSKVILVKSQLFVNNTGQAVKKIKNFYKIRPEDIVVIHDDLDTPFGKTKLCFNSGSGGHKGIQSIIDGLKTQKFYRLKIGTSNKDLVKARKEKNSKKRIEGIGHFVLSEFPKIEQSKLNSVFKQAIEKIESIM